MPFWQFHQMLMKLHPQETRTVPVPRQNYKNIANHTAFSTSLGTHWILQQPSERNTTMFYENKVAQPVSCFMQKDKLPLSRVVYVKNIGIERKEKLLTL